MKTGRLSYKVAVLVAMLVLGITGCANTEDLGPGSERDPAPAESVTASEDGTEEVAEEATEEAIEELEADEAEASEEDWRFVEEFAEPFVWEDGGVRLSITGIGITDATSSEVPAEVSQVLGEDTQTVVVLEMTASNDTGQTINFYPAQGTIQVLREQLTSEVFLSDSIAGNDWRDGVDGDGQVFWALQNTTFEEAVGAGELTFISSAASSIEDYQSLTQDVEIAVTWSN